MTIYKCGANQFLGLLPKEEIKRTATVRAYLSALIFLMVFTLTPRLFAQDNSSAPYQDTSSQQNAPADNPPSRVARISFLRGRVSFLRAGLTQWSEAELNFPVTTGDRLYTDKDSRAELQVCS